MLSKVWNYFKNFSITAWRSNLADFDKLWYQTFPLNIAIIKAKKVSVENTEAVPFWRWCQFRTLDLTKNRFHPMNYTFLSSERTELWMNCNDCCRLTSSSTSYLKKLSLCTKAFRGLCNYSNLLNKGKRKSKPEHRIE